MKLLVELGELGMVLTSFDALLREIVAGGRELRLRLGVQPERHRQRDREGVSDDPAIHHFSPRMRATRRSTR